MELFQVRYFLALSKSLNFTRAAEACNVTQPALTRAIQRLEEELGGALLYRERSLTQLTELGKVMLPHLEAAFVAAQTASAQAAAFRRRADAPLHLGLNPTISARILMPVLRELGDRINAFELTLVEGISDALFVKMLDGELDAAVVAEPDKLPGTNQPLAALRGSLPLCCANRAIGLLSLARSRRRRSPKNAFSSGRKTDVISTSCSLVYLLPRTVNGTPVIAAATRIMSSKWSQRVSASPFRPPASPLRRA